MVIQTRSGHVQKFARGSVWIAPPLQDALWYESNSPQKAVFKAFDRCRTFFEFIEPYGVIEKTGTLCGTSPAYRQLES